MFAYVYMHCFHLFIYLYFFVAPKLHSSVCDTEAAAAAEREVKQEQEQEEEEVEGTGTASPDWRYEASQPVGLSVFRGEGLTRQDP